jgi:dsRNA-specific ribonuclease
LGQQQLRAQAWLGDAVLGLLAREWLMGQGLSLDSTAFQQMTSNQFLATFGQPTRVEAGIGLLYAEAGLDAVRQWFTAALLPRYQAQENNRRRGGC